VNQPPRADASATVSVVISPNGSNTVVTLDGSRSSDPEGAPLRYFWYHSGAAVPLATGVVAVVTLPVATNALMLVVDDGLDTNSQAFTVEVITAIQAIERLRNWVRAEAERPQPFVVTLSAAIASLRRDNPTAAVNQLQAFQNKVRAQVSSDDPALAAQWLQAAQQIIDALGGVVHGERGRFTAVKQVENGSVWLRFAATPGATHIIEASTNLMNWEKIGVALGCGDGVYEFSDPNTARRPVRFYRIVSP